MKLTIKNTKGKEAGSLDLSFQPVASGKGNQAVHDVVVAYMAAQRSGTASTKTMGDVVGSGKKPWRQKGTGRARAGSFASPLWRGGGVVFGPKPRDFTKKINVKTRQLALRKALSERIKAGEVVIVDDLKLTSAKTKDFVNLLNKLDIDDTALFISQAADKNLMLASRNLPQIEVTTSEFLNTYQVLRPSKLVFTRSAFEKVEDRLGKE